MFYTGGAVLMTGGGSHTARGGAGGNFGRKWYKYSDRHEKVAHAIETNRLTLEQYLDRAVFYRPQAFSREEFRAFIFAQSEPKPDSLGLVKELADSDKYFMATLNNEIMELNVYRIEQFGLRRYF